MASKTKDKVASLPGAAEDGSASDTFNDPLDVNRVNPDLLILNYQEDFKRPYSILLNKFNTIADHVSTTHPSNPIEFKILHVLYC